jgi:catechol 2,3-dioxygenase-like lactoylglutathione lyase family enzyme
MKTRRRLQKGSITLIAGVWYVRESAPPRINDMLFATDASKMVLCASEDHLSDPCWCTEKPMPEASSIPPRVNGVLEASLYVESAARSAEFYRRVFGFEPLEPNEPLNDETRLCPMRAGDRSVLLLFKRGATPDTDATGAIHIAFAIARSDLKKWEHWLSEQRISIELRKTWKHGGEALYFRDPDGHLLEVVTPGVWSIY